MTPTEIIAKLTGFDKDIADLKATADKDRLDLTAAHGTISDLQSKLSEATSKLTASEGLVAKLRADAEKADGDKEDGASDSYDQVLKDLKNVIALIEALSGKEGSGEGGATGSDADDSTDDSEMEKKMAAGKRFAALAVATRKLSRKAAKAKAAHASVPALVAQQLARIGIKTPIATKPADSPFSALKGRDRVAAAFTAELATK